MQQRSMQRYRSVLNVFLYHKDKILFSGCAENVCSDGIFVKTGLMDLPKKDDLRIGFHSNLDGDREIYKIPVNFIHSNNNGLGLKFKLNSGSENVYNHTLLGFVIRSRW